MPTLPANAALLAFEGPDPYSTVGGLSTRVTELSAALAAMGVRTTLIFVGDPARAPVEEPGPNLEYRRWCQWISAYYPGGVYDGEGEKMSDYTRSAPAFVIDSIVEPAAKRGESILVIAEDWQTAPAVILLDRLLRERDLRARAILIWNANNTYGFHTIDWIALARAARITTVSRYMKFELSARSVEAWMIPNGIPDRILGGPPDELVRAASERLAHRPLFVKVARFEEEKRWMPAVDAFAAIRARHPSATFIARGGGEAYGDRVFARARHLGLTVEDVATSSREPEEVLEAIAGARAPIVNVRSFIPEEMLFTLYHVADAVIANSGSEPFGLVGLEVMAAGGVAVTGSTGEEYAQPFENAIVCDTGSAAELAAYLGALIDDPALARTIRAAGQSTAERYTWPIVLDILARKLSY
jgi:glycosyltransferase involved in cell wall biosynthesis